MEDQFEKWWSTNMLFEVLEINFLSEASLILNLYSLPIIYNTISIQLNFKDFLGTQSINFNKKFQLYAHIQLQLDLFNTYKIVRVYTVCTKPLKKSRTCFEGSLKTWSKTMYGWKKLYSWLQQIQINIYSRFKKPVWSFSIFVYVYVSAKQEYHV